MGKWLLERAMLMKCWARSPQPPVMNCDAGVASLPATGVAAAESDLVDLTHSRYLQLARVWHPDKSAGGDQAAANAAFARIQKAW